MGREAVFRHPPRPVFRTGSCQRPDTDGYLLTRNKHGSGKAPDGFGKRGRFRHVPGRSFGVKGPGADEGRISAERAHPVPADADIIAGEHRSRHVARSVL